MAENAENATVVVEVVVGDEKRLAHKPPTCLPESNEEENSHVKNKMPTRAAAIDRPVDDVIMPGPKIMPTKPQSTA